ncbi:MAG TPA: M13 family metallopeptidase [Acidobacteriaceae bacterium]
MKDPTRRTPPAPRQPRLPRPLATASLAALLLASSLPSSAQSGIFLADIDRKADPCSDFYAYSNGAWRAQNPIPSSMDRWSRRWQAGENNKDQLRTLLDEISSHLAPKGTPAQLTGDFYAACTNVPAIDHAGIQPVEPLLHQIAAIHTAADLQAVLESLHTDGLAVPFMLNPSPDNHAPQNTIADVGAGGLGLPDRDYYLKPEKRFADARAGYLLHVAKLFELAGETPAAAKASAQSVMDFETSLARASLDNVALRDPSATDHKMAFAALQQLTPHFDWAAYYRSASLTPAPLNVDQPDFLKEFDRQLAATPIPAWKTYLTWQVLHGSADLLSQPFVDANFAFYGQQLAGVGELKPRPTRCAEQTDTALGEALGQEYVKRYFPPEAKARATDMVTNIIAAMHDTIEGATWMTPETKAKAIEKLSTLVVKVGYPNTWRDYSSIPISRDHYFADTLAANRFEVARERAKIGKPTDRTEWGMTPPTSNAYYNPQLNEIVFPAGILQPPAFDAKAPDAVNYGAIGVVIGHEISHGFDDQGAQFDAQGELHNWWNAEDLKQFQAKTACVAHQFDGYTIDGPDNIHINGKLTLGESIGDLGGVKIAYLAFQKAQQGKPPAASVAGYTPDQQFFLAWGQFRGDETRPETQKMMTQGDPHPVAKYRVLGPLSNFEPFAAAFQCRQGQAMVRPEKERCIVW